MHIYDIYDDELCLCIVVHLSALCPHGSYIHIGASEIIADKVGSVLRLDSP